MKAKLINESLPFEIVEFDFNPETLKYTRETQSTSRANNSTGGGGGATPSILLSSPPKSLAGDGYMIGDDVQDRADQLYTWMDAGGGLLGQVIGAALNALTGGRINLAAKQPPLYFQWGTQMMRCILKTVNVTFERFDSSGNPVRAKISFKVQEETDIFGMLPTNPTSGGLPGRQRHVVSGSENVQTISTAAYGNPRMWRGVAEANGIDDPFRVKAGDTVYLPNANEIVRRR
jgi:hypothetical protein